MNWFCRLHPTTHTSRSWQCVHKTHWVFMKDCVRVLALLEQIKFQNSTFITEAYFLWFGFFVCKQNVFVITIHICWKILLQIPEGIRKSRRLFFFFNIIWSKFHTESSQEHRRWCCFCTTNTEMLIFKATTLQILS